jgi:drug/metabolite transporter (DMT)-like permease
MSDPFVFTTTKNVAVALMLFAFFLLPKALPEMKALTRKQWLTLGAIGCVGGSVPFLLFFYGLSQGTAAGAAFIHKTLFIWVAILAVIFLGERLGKLQWTALATLVGGNLLLLGWPKNWMGDGECLMLAATLFWAIEAVVAKKVMAQVSANVAAFGRMFFGSIVMLTYLGFAGKLDIITGLSAEQIGWITLTGVFLLVYVSFYYTGLRHAPASVVASLLVPGSVITSMLYAFFDAKRYSVDEIAGMGFIVVAALVLWYIAPKLVVSRRTVSGVAEK